MKLKWWEYIAEGFGLIGLIIRHKGLKNVEAFLDKEKAKLQKEHETMIEGIRLQLEEMVELAITRRFKEMQMRASDEGAVFLRGL